jgi:hypothetical protein
MVKKMIGAITILIMLINVSLNIRAVSANSGKNKPVKMPATIAIKTNAVKFLNIFNFYNWIGLYAKVNI